MSPKVSHPNDFSSDTKAKEVLPYFAPILPWQKTLWQQVSQQFYHDKLPHALLAGGMIGIGKRAFVWRFVAWLLCQDKLSDNSQACGGCPSCLWLKAGTHPDLLVLPPSSRINEESDEHQIKIDDVRFLQDYSHAKGHGLRLIVLDNAESLLLSSANALLKTLEEPRSGVHLILITDSPARLLPTIKSRLQTLPLTPIDHCDAITYLNHNLPSDLKPMSSLLLNLADGAPLYALSLPNQPWFDKRLLWIKTFIALQKKTRTPIIASQYWKSILGFDDFITLTRMMLLEILRVSLGMTGIHEDIDSKELLKSLSDLQLEAVYTLLDELNQITKATWQNLQEELAYDKLMTCMANLH